MKRSIIGFLFLIPCLTGLSQSDIKETEMIRYDDYTYLADQVKVYRKDRLLTLDQFNVYANETNTVILDTRSDSMYIAKHVKGAIHLNFSDFTAENLAALIPDPNTRILIYCNNNFVQDNQTMLQDMYFPSKVSYPNPINSYIEIAPREDKPANERSRRGYSLSSDEETDFPLMNENGKEYTLALNIPTFISLYGYGYRNVYELRDLVNTTDFRIAFEGTAVPDSPLTVISISTQPSVLVNFDDYSQLMAEVKPHRAERLVSLDRFNELATLERTIILDFRSKAQYDAKHVKGAIHLDFTEFTQETLNNLIPDKSMNVLIYCNNNFVSDLESLSEDPYFESKMAMPKEKNLYRKLSLALNVPAYINLYGYGFKNVYELAETVAISDPRIRFEGSAVK